MLAVSWLLSAKQTLLVSFSKKPRLSLPLPPRPSSQFSGHQDGFSSEFISVSLSLSLSHSHSHTHTHTHTQHALTHCTHTQHARTELKIPEMSVVLCLAFCSSSCLQNQCRLLGSGGPAGLGGVCVLVHLAQATLYGPQVFMFDV